MEVAAARSPVSCGRLSKQGAAIRRNAIPIHQHCNNHHADEQRRSFEALIKMIRGNKSFTNSVKARRTLIWPVTDIPPQYTQKHPKFFQCAFSNASLYCYSFIIVSQVEETDKIPQFVTTTE